MGITTPNEDSHKDFVKITSRVGGHAIEYDGSISENDRIIGTYLHGIFDNSKFTNDYMNRIREAKGLALISAENAPENFWDFKNKQYDKLADLVEENIDKSKLYEIIGI